jgi:hypothetical protein
MGLRRGMFLVLCLCLFSVGAFADSVTAQFNLNPSLQMVPSQGSINIYPEPGWKHSSVCDRYQRI